MQRLSLNEETGQDVFEATSAADAKHGYELIDEFEAGHYNEHVRKHLAKGAPRKKRT